MTLEEVKNNKILAPNSIVHADCLEAMQYIPDNSIDMILCDLPYGTTACKWDIVIPFEPLWNQYKRIITDNGCIALFGSEPFSSKLRISNLEMFKYDWIWHKNKPTGNFIAKRQPMRAYENICIFYQNQPIYIPQMVKRTEEEFKACFREKDSIYNNGEQFGKGSKGIIIRKTMEEQQYKYPINILKIASADKRNGEQHPTQKPVPLLEYFIKTYTNENEVVLDNCAGSFSTIIACINLNRKYIGIEKDEKYFNIGKERIKKRLKEKSFEMEPIF